MNKGKTVYFQVSIRSAIQRVRCCLLLFWLTGSLSLDVLLAQNPLATLFIESNELTCPGDSDGAITFAATGGTPPYTYEWSQLNNAFVFANGEILQEGTAATIGGDLPANTYFLRLTDAAGWVLRDTIAIVQPPPIQVLDIMVADATCATLCDGRIGLTVSGGTGNLTTIWTDTAATTNRREQLCAGEYVFILTDDRGCTQKGSVELAAPASLMIQATLNNPTCAGAANGQIAIAATGGTGGYQYNWSNAESSATLTDRSTGTYTLTVTDANDCNLVSSFFLPDGPTLNPNLQFNYGCGDGQVIVRAHPLNGTAPYAYLWSTGQLTPLLAGMSAGNYGLSLTDANGCRAETAFAIDYVPPLRVQPLVENVSCTGARDGRIELSIAGGLPPFAVLWSNGATTTRLTGLPGGEYLYNLTSTGCGLARSVLVGEPGPLGISIVFSPQTNDLLTGTAIVSGGTPPFQLSWSSGSSAFVATNLVPGAAYQVSVTDANGCVQTEATEAIVTDLAAIFSEEQIRVFPNPGTDWLYLQLPLTLTQEVHFGFYNSLGQLLAQGLCPNTTSQPLLNISSFPADVYLLQLNCAGVQVLKTFVKE